MSYFNIYLQDLDGSPKVVDAFGREARSASVRGISWDDGGAPVVALSVRLSRGALSGPPPLHEALASLCWSNPTAAPLVRHLSDLGLIGRPDSAERSRLDQAIGLVDRWSVTYVKNSGPWVSTDAYCAALTVTHQGRIWRAVCDTHQEPGTGDDWIEIGDDGQPVKPARDAEIIAAALQLVEDIGSAATFDDAADAAERARDRIVAALQPRATEPAITWSFTPATITADDPEPPTDPQDEAGAARRAPEAVAQQESPQPSGAGLGWLDEERMLGGWDPATGQPLEGDDDR